MNKISINESEVRSFISNILYSSKINFVSVKDAKYHHIASYENTPLICEYGLLSLKELNRLKIREDSSDALERMDDTESHINGNNGISLFVLGLDDLYRDEDEYDSISASDIDFIISDRIKAYRNSLHYGNEYISFNNNIDVDNILSIDFRILEYMSLMDKQNIPVKKLVEMYNNLLLASQVLKNKKAQILLREMSQDPFNIDIDKLSSESQIVLKK